MYEHQSSLDDWTRYGVRLPMFLGGIMLIAATVSIVLSYSGHINPAGIPIGISVATVGGWLIVDAFFKIQHLKRKEVNKHHRSKQIQIQWEEEVERDKELLKLAAQIPEKEIEPAFYILMQAVKKQIVLCKINQELLKRGKSPFPEVSIPDTFPKSVHCPKYLGGRSVSTSAFDIPFYSRNKPYSIGTDSSKTCSVSMPDLCVTDFEQNVQAFCKNKQYSYIEDSAADFAPFSYQPNKHVTDNITLVEKSLTLQGFKNIENSEIDSSI